MYEKEVVVSSIVLGFSSSAFLYTYLSGCVWLIVSLVSCRFGCVVVVNVENPLVGHLCLQLSGKYGKEEVESK